MIITTTSSVEGTFIIDYLGVVTGEAVMGNNFVRDMFANIADSLGTRSRSYEKSLREAKEVAMEIIREQAEQLGANAIVGLSLDYEVMGKENGMLMLSVAGTAVRIER